MCLCVSACLCVCLCGCVVCVHVQRCCQVTQGQPSLRSTAPSPSVHLTDSRVFLRYFITWSCQKQSQQDCCVCAQSASAAAHTRRNELSVQAVNHADVSRPSPPKHGTQHRFYVPLGSERQPRKQRAACMPMHSVCDRRGDCFYTEHSREKQKTISEMFIAQRHSSDSGGACVTDQRIAQDSVSSVKTTR